MQDRYAPEETHTIIDRARDGASVAAFKVVVVVVVVVVVDLENFL